MSETYLASTLNEPEAKRAPTVYFIDDSATMREVIKIAFRRENISVITCADAASALAQFSENPPDAVITDVIMPDQDGYSVCSQIKAHEKFGKVPVILMSGVVNKAVADKAVAVQADELIRKPFQPQELIGRVKSFLDPKPAQSQRPTSDTAAPAANPLSGLFAPPVPVAFPQAPVTEAPAGETPWPRALAEAFTPRPQASPAAPQQIFAPAAPRPAAPSADLRLRAEIARLELLVKKLQTELQIERQYNQALELHVRTLTAVE